MMGQNGWLGEQYLRRSDRLKSTPDVNYSEKFACHNLEESEATVDEMGETPNDMSGESATGEFNDQLSNEELQKLISEENEKHRKLSELENHKLRNELIMLRKRNAELEGRIRSGVCEPSRQGPGGENVGQPPEFVPIRDQNNDVLEFVRDVPMTHKMALNQIDNLISTHNRRKTGGAEEMTGHSSANGDSEGSVFSLECRDKRRGKTRHTKHNCCSRANNNKSVQSSGLKDQVSQKIVNKQNYPHAALQHEYLGDWSGNEIQYKDLQFGL